MMKEQRNGGAGLHLKAQTFVDNVATDLLKALLTMRAGSHRLQFKVQLMESLGDGIYPDKKYFNWLIGSSDE